MILIITSYLYYLETRARYLESVIQRHGITYEPAEPAEPADKSFEDLNSAPNLSLGHQSSVGERFARVVFEAVKEKRCRCSFNAPIIDGHLPFKFLPFPINNFTMGCVACDAIRSVFVRLGSINITSTGTIEGMTSRYNHRSLYLNAEFRRTALSSLLHGSTNFVSIRHFQRVLYVRSSKELQLLQGMSPRV
jgi:hypothetical protein